MYGYKQLEWWTYLLTYKSYSGARRYFSFNSELNVSIHVSLKYFGRG